MQKLPEESENENIQMAISNLMKTVERQEEEMNLLEQEIESQKLKDAKVQKNDDSISKQQQLNNLREKKESLKTQLRLTPRHRLSFGKSEQRIGYGVDAPKTSDDISTIQRNKTIESALNDKLERLAKLEADEVEIRRLINRIRNEIDKNRVDIENEQNAIQNGQRRLDRANEKLERLRDKAKQLRQQNRTGQRKNVAPQTTIDGGQNPLVFFNSTIRSQIESSTVVSAVPRVRNERAAIVRDYGSNNRLNEAVKKLRLMHSKLKMLEEMVGAAKSEEIDEYSSSRTSGSEPAASKEPKKNQKLNEPIVLDIYLPVSSESAEPTTSDIEANKQSNPESKPTIPAVNLLGVNKVFDFDSADI